MSTLKNHSWNAQAVLVSEKLCEFVPLNCWLRAAPLSAITNCFEFRCQQNQLMLSSYKICRCCCQVEGDQDAKDKCHNTANHNKIG